MLQEPTTKITRRLHGLILLAATLPAHAQDPQPRDELQLTSANPPKTAANNNLVGKCVVPRLDKFTLRDDTQAIIKDGTEFVVYRVERVDPNGRLRLHAVGSALVGWSMADQVVLVDEPLPATQPAPPPASPALREWAQMPDELLPTRNDNDERNPWRNSAGLEPRDVAETFKKMFSGKSDVARELMIAEFTEVLERDPNSASTYYFRGVALKERKEYAKAIDDFSAAIKLNSRDAQAYCARGASWAELKRYDKAIADFTDAIKIDPLRADAYYFRGYAYLARKKYDESIADLTEVIRLNPGSAAAHGIRGWAWEKKGDLDKAIADYDESLRYDPQSASAYVQRGAAWGSKKEYDKAIADFNEALRLDASDAEAYYFRAMTWCAKDQLDLGLQDMNRAIKLDPKLMGAYATRGRIWYAKKEFAKAISDFDQAIRRQPQLAALYLSRAEAWQRQHIYDKAMADYNEAVDIDPKNALFLNNLAWLLATCAEPKFRDGKKAVELSTKACELTDWKEPGYLDTLAAAYAESANYPAAANWQKKAIELIKNDAEKADYHTRLSLYESKKPYHDSTP